MSARLIEFDVSQVEGLLDDLVRLDDVTIAEMRRDAVNLVALTVNRKSVDQTQKELNLTRDYIESRIARTDATGNSAKARLVSEQRGATLQRYGATEISKPVTWSNARIQSLGKKFGKWPGWTRRTGDESRGIPADYKLDGVMVQVKRGGGDQHIERGFMLPLKAGKEAGGNGFGVFARSKDGTIKHRYGPSVYQTFRRYINENETAIADSLRDEFTGKVESKLREVFK